MLAITLIQPYATLIVHHGKDVENRSWPLRHRGPMLIHAGMKRDPAGWRMAADLGIILPEEVPAGGLIGQVDVVGCVRDSESPWAMPGQWHWLLANPRELPFQKMRGQRGLFHVGEPDQGALFNPEPDRS